MLVTIATFLVPSDAHLLRGRLEAEGVPATVAFDGHVTANWAMAMALGGVAVQVSPADREEAEVIAKAHAAGEYALAEDSDDADAEDRRAASDAPACGHCGSRDVQRRVPMTDKLLAVGLFLFGGALFPTRSRVWSCGHCYYRWSVDA